MTAGHSRFTRHFPTVVPVTRSPRVTADAIELTKDQRYCTFSERPLVRKFAWLELDQRVNAYHDFGGVPTDNSQGWFPFGLTAPKPLLKTETARKEREVGYMPPHADVLQWEHLPFPKSLRDFQRLFPR